MAVNSTYARVGRLVHYKDASRRIRPALVAAVNGTARDLVLLGSRTAVTNVPLMTHRAAVGPSWYPGSRSEIPV